MFYFLLLILALIFLLGLVVKIYIKITTRRCTSQTCLVGKTIIVTGANTGIGYETALDFAKRGARVILACRDQERANTACRNIIQETGNENVVVKLIDLSSFNSVRAFAEEINNTEPRLDILVNNAGSGGTRDKKSKDGHLLLMQINYFSSFLLTNLLIDLLKKTGNSRVVNVSSLTARMSKNFDLATIDQFPTGFQVYCHSKLCNILFTVELAKKLKDTGITTFSLHPGAVNTDIFRNYRGFMKTFINVSKKLFFLTSEEGAQTTIHCSVAKDIEHLSGQHFDKCQRIERYKIAENAELSKKLWQCTEQIVYLTPKENPFIFN